MTMKGEHQSQRSTTTAALAVAICTLFCAHVPIANAFSPSSRAPAVSSTLPTPLISASCKPAAYLSSVYEYHRDATALQSTATDTSAASSTSVPRLPSSAIVDLSAKGYAIIPNFLPPDLVSDLNADVSSLRSGSKFNVARIGQDATNKLNTDIRVAETCFVGRTKLQDCPDAARERLYDALDGVRNDLSGNSVLDDKSSSTGELIKAAPALDSTLSELLYAYYPQGGFYRRHRDAISGSASVLRSYSLLLYLNENWTPEDEGQLRMHFDSGGDFLPEGEGPNYIDVEPRGGTLVLFKSDQVPHEVLDTKAQRLAVVGWYNRAVSAADIGELASNEDKMRAGMLLAAAGLVTVGLVSLLT
eukprot:CAMPEP_0185827454 /NCGR_PEP_ID=MMETSP1322-20130828/32059_1 /TAXON_ID=265543 /ORGANISM="Minutocellus polymorphus, Strain RCC2270" /LENGTH=359 /DNA_ID=CAMNT_0028525187 /DNA_START=24 /DNA_END=1103 /DNA_ORIENTATION=-